MSITVMLTYNVSKYQDKVAINIFMPFMGLNVIRSDTDKGNSNLIMKQKRVFDTAYIYTTKMYLYI